MFSESPSWASSVLHLTGRDDIRGLNLDADETGSSHWLLSQLLTGHHSVLDVVDRSGDCDRLQRSAGNEETTTAGGVAGYGVGSQAGAPRRTRIVSLNALTREQDDTPRYDFVHLSSGSDRDTIEEELSCCWPLLHPGGVLIGAGWERTPGGSPLQPAIDKYFFGRSDYRIELRDDCFVARKTVGIEAVVVCVNYSDYLVHTLPTLTRWVDDVVVVSTPNDRATAEVVAGVPGASLVTTNVFFRGGAIFRKEAAINVGLKALTKSGWVLSVDADILLPTPIPLPSDDQRDALFGSSRYRLQDAQEAERVAKGLAHETRAEGRNVIPLVRIKGNYAPSGYFQLWHWNSQPVWRPEGSRDASRGDIYFALEWPPERRKRLPGYRVFHLETPDNFRGANWRGRVTERFTENGSDERMSSGPSRGVLTASNTKYWPTLRLLAEATIRTGHRLAIVDHGLSERQREWLTDLGATLHLVDEAEHVRMPRPGAQWMEPPSAPKAWLKPWLCLNSPFDQTVWIDADAVPLRGLERMFSLLNESPFLTLDGWVSRASSHRAYRNLVTMILGELPPCYDDYYRINSGVFAFHRDDEWVKRWWAMCERILGDPDLLGTCKLRDQAALVATLCCCTPDVPLPKIQRSRGLNWPANGVRVTHRNERVRYPWCSPELLSMLRREHPTQTVIHWLGTPKPWRMT